MNHDMPMSGTPWMTGPVKLHSGSTYKCSLNNTDLCSWQTGYWRFWYEADHRYALPTVALFMTVIILFALGAIFNDFASERTLRSRPIQRLTALNRWLSHRSWRIPFLNWNSAPLGVLLLGAVGTIYFFAMTLGPRPYYWPNVKAGTGTKLAVSFGSSPPIATRSGWLSLGCLPFVFATAGKSNLITMVTGVSHEKLQVFHRWISYAMFVTALIHTFPFIIYHIWLGDMVTKWQTDMAYWTGTVALIAQAYSTFASMGPLRNYCYEWFKFSHFVSGLVFVIFYFFHCDFILSSWDYFIATGVLFVVSWLHRQLRVWLEHGVSHEATLSIATNGFIRVSVPTTATWRAGQHFFVRFRCLGLHSWTNHPFTACSLPTRAGVNEGAESELVFYIRPQGGFTSRLAKHVEHRPERQCHVMLDGPFGGIDMRKLASADRSLVIAGGSGAGWTLPLITAFLRRLQLQDVEKQKDMSMRVILATRDLATQTWFEKAVAQELAACPVDTLTSEQLNVEIHYTGREENANAPHLTGQFLSKLDDPEKSGTVDTVNSASGSDTGSTGGSSSVIKWMKAQHALDRPNLPSIIAEESASRGDSTLGVFVCGPLSMQHDVSNAVAKQQLAILKKGAGDVYLHMEHFSWA